MIVWLSSYPRSGNTFFRVILNSVFHLKTYSIYNDTGDIGADEATSDIVGHAFLPEDFDIDKARESTEIYYIKTHDLLENVHVSSLDKVIYLIRDGRESTLSFAKHRKNYYGKSDDLKDVIYGNTLFGSWGQHVMQWSHIENQLLIKFEELTKDPTSQLEKIANYLQITPIDAKIPSFNELQEINPTFFRSGKKDSWKKVYSEQEHLAFWLRNYEAMLKFGYNTDIPQEVQESSFQTYRALFEEEIEALKANLPAADISKQHKLKHKLDQVIKSHASLLSDLKTISSLNPIKKIFACQTIMDSLEQYSLEE